jgi:hypothetical protein
LFEKIKVFFKNQKHEPNIVEITHLCIMHRVHTSINRCTINIQDIKNILKKKATWDEPIEKAQP